MNNINLNDWDFFVRIRLNILLMFEEACLKVVAEILKTFVGNTIFF